MSGRTIDDDTAVTRLLSAVKEIMAARKRLILKVAIERNALRSENNGLRTCIRRQDEEIEKHEKTSGRLNKALAELRNRTRRTREAGKKASRN